MSRNLISRLLQVVDNLNSLARRVKISLKTY